MSDVTWALINLSLFGLNAFMAVTNFMAGKIGLGVFSGAVAIWCMVFMITHIVKGVNEK